MPAKASTPPFAKGGVKTRCGRALVGKKKAWPVVMLVVEGRLGDGVFDLVDLGVAAELGMNLPAREVDLEAEEAVRGLELHLNRVSFDADVNEEVLVLQLEGEDLRFGRQWVNEYPVSEVEGLASILPHDDEGRFARDLYACDAFVRVSMQRHPYLLSLARPVQVGRLRCAAGFVNEV